MKYKAWHKWRKYALHGWLNVFLMDVIAIFTLPNYFPMFVILSIIAGISLLGIIFDDET